MKPKLQKPFGIRAFTLVETMVASSLGVVILAGGFLFLNTVIRSTAGVTAQTVLNQQGGNALELLQSRIRLSTSNSVSSTGNTLTLGFDDNYNVDSDGNGRAYDDKDHYEVFKFVGFNSSDLTKCSTNKLLYYPNKNSDKFRTLISSGVRNLPGKPIFALTNTVVVVIRLGIVDTYARDSYQAIDVQGTGVSLNRPVTTNVLSNIFP